MHNFDWILVANGNSIKHEESIEFTQYRPAATDSHRNYRIILEWINTSKSQ